ncbi:MAG: hypothetical protein LBK66_02845 [Spirochaetaceae bacterium]|jgi:hypothetical protein|nr:hypothetical protein [Spirochaetaceae bacterium]
MYNPILVSNLKKCKNEEEVESVFSNFHKEDDKTKIRYLNICRGNPQTFFAGVAEENDEKEIHSRYLTIRSMFLTGSWR